MVEGAVLVEVGEKEVLGGNLSDCRRVDVSVCQKEVTIWLTTILLNVCRQDGRSERSPRAPSSNSHWKKKSTPSRMSQSYARG